MEVVDISVSADTLLLRADPGIPALVVLRARGSAENVLVQSSGSEDSLEIAFADLERNLPADATRFDLYAGDNIDALSQITVRDPSKRPYWRRFFRAEGRSTAMQAHVYVNLQGKLTALRRTALAVDIYERNFQAMHQIDDVRFFERGVHVAFRIEVQEKGHFEIERVFIKLEAEGDVVELDGAHMRSGSGSGLSGTYIFDGLRKAALAPLRYTWNVSLQDRETKQRVFVRLNRASEELHARLMRKAVSGSTPLDGGRVLTLSGNAGTTHLGLIVRPVSETDVHPIRQRVFGLVARTMGVLTRLTRLRPKPTALVFEKEAATAQDNGLALFQYLRSTGIVHGSNYYFVIDRRSSQWSRVAAMGNVLPKHSLRVWILLARQNTFLVSSDVRFHLANLYAQPDYLNKLLYARRSYFLQHGVLGLKRVGMLRPGSATEPEATVVSANWEKSLLVDSEEVPPERIDVTGLPRWDRIPLDGAPPAGIQTILYMPTWRTWLEGRSPAELERSEFFSRILELLGSPLLSTTLERIDCRLLVLLHPRFHELSSKLRSRVASSRVEVLSQDEVELRSLVVAADALLTDYSSVMWDFVQLRKPVGLYQFDRERFDRFEGRYEQETLDEIIASIPTTSSSSEVCELIESFATGIKSLADELDERRTLAFSLSDEQNSERVWQAVESRANVLSTPRKIPTYFEADLYYRNRLSSLTETVKKWSSI